MRIGAERIVTPGGVVTDGVLVVAGERIVAVEAGGADERLPGWLVPGFVDTHTHGGGGADFTDPDPTPAIATHRAHGSTSIIASTVTNDLAVLTPQVGRLAALVRAGELAGVHLEGPCLAHARRGAHNPALLREPSPDVIDPLVAVGGGAVRMVTLAPELPGGIDAVRRLTAAGVTVAFGHSDADADQTRAALDAGARVATHAFNAMRPIRHREPGPIPVLLDDPRVLVELICDGVHIDPEVVRLAVRAAGVDRVALVTDAMAATGQPDGEYPLGAMTAVVREGVARIKTADGTPGAIAGSTLTMDRAFAFCVALGFPIEAVAAMAATNPARAHGLGDVGALAPGRLADACLVDDEGLLQRVLRRGEWLRPAG